MKEGREVGKERALNDERKGGRKGKRTINDERKAERKGKRTTTGGHRREVSFSPIDILIKV